jgi:hypothetical protein
MIVAAKVKGRAMNKSAEVAATRIPGIGSTVRTSYGSGDIAFETVVRMVELRNCPLASLPSGSMRMQPVLPRSPNIPGTVVWLQSPK